MSPIALGIIIVGFPAVARRLLAHPRLLPGAEREAEVTAAVELPGKPAQQHSDALTFVI
jgi:hypothetical protein